MVQSGATFTSQPRSRRNLLQKRNHKTEQANGETKAVFHRSRSRSRESKRKSHSSTLAFASRLSAERRPSSLAYRLDSIAAQDSHHIQPVDDDFIHISSPLSESASGNTKTVAAAIPSETAESETPRRTIKSGTEGRKGANVAGKLRGKLPGASSVGRGRRVEGPSDTAPLENVGFVLENAKPTTQSNMLGTNDTSSSGRRRKSYPLAKISEQISATAMDEAENRVSGPLDKSEAIPPLKFLRRMSSDLGSVQDFGPATITTIRDEKSVISLRFNSRSANRTPLSTPPELRYILTPRRKLTQTHLAEIEGELTSEELFDSLPAMMHDCGGLYIDGTDLEGSTGRGGKKSRSIGKRQRKLKTRRKGDRQIISQPCNASLDDIEPDGETEADFSSEQVLDSSKDDEVAWLAHQVELLEARLAESEEELRQLLDSSKENERRFNSEVGRLKTILGTVDQAQEIRYNSLLDVFTDNFRAMGTVEAQFEQMLGARHQQMQSSGKGQLLYALWKIADFAVKALLQLFQLVARSYKYLKG